MARLSSVLNIGTVLDGVLWRSVLKRAAVEHASLTLGNSPNIRTCWRQSRTSIPRRQLKTSLTMQWPLRNRSSRASSRTSVLNTEGQWTQGVEVAKGVWWCFFMSFAKRSGVARPLRAASREPWRLMTFWSRRGARPQQWSRHRHIRRNPVTVFLLPLWNSADICSR